MHNVDFSTTDYSRRAHTMLYEVKFFSRKTKTFLNPDKPAATEPFNGSKKIIGKLINFFLFMTSETETYIFTYDIYETAFTLINYKWPEIVMTLFSKNPVC